MQTACLIISCLYFMLFINNFTCQNLLLMFFVKLMIMDFASRQNLLFSSNGCQEKSSSRDYQEEVLESSSLS